MDQSTVVLDISSDEEFGWGDPDGKGIPDITDDHNWIAEILNEVNSGEDCKGDDDDDSDEVVLVSEVLPSNPRKKKPKSSSLIELDDDCVILDNDPDKPVEIRRRNPRNGDDSDDSDDLLVVSEKGQVACRDYPHSRHLCIKFPFSSTPNQSHCEQCYCFVCDSLAPCVYWGTGSSSTDHCHATDKDEFWILERKNSKNGSKSLQPVPRVADTYLLNPLPTVNPAPLSSSLAQPIYVAQSQVSRSSSAHACSMSANLGVRNNINQNRNPSSLTANKYHPGLVSQQLTRTNNSGTQRDRRYHSYNLGTHFAFKRTASAGVTPTAHRFPYSSYRGNNGIPPPPSRRNSSTQLDSHVGGRLSGSQTYLGSTRTNTVNASVPFPSQISTTSTVNALVEEPLHFQHELPYQSNPNIPYDPSLSLQSQVNSVNFQPNPVTFSSQPQVVSSHPSYSVPSQPQVMPSHPNYMVPSQTGVDGQSTSVSNYCHNASQQGNQAWEPSQTNYVVPSQTGANGQSTSVSNYCQTTSQQGNQAWEPSHANYVVPSQTGVDGQSTSFSNYGHNVSQQVNQAQSSAVDPRSIEYGVSWSPVDTNQQTTIGNSQQEGTAAPTNESSLLTVPGGFDDYQYNSWIYENQPVEPGSTDAASGPYGFNEFSPEPALIDTGTLFYF